MSRRRGLTYKEALREWMRESVDVGELFEFDGALLAGAGNVYKCDSSAVALYCAGLEDDPFERGVVRYFESGFDSSSMPSSDRQGMTLGGCGQRGAAGGRPRRMD